MRCVPIYVSRYTLLLESDCLQSLITSSLSGKMQARMPSLFVSHGLCGPMPILGDPAHAGLYKFLRGAASLLPSQPKAIIIVNAHWEESVPTLATSPAPPMNYDYHGFPPASYQIKYPAPGGSPELINRVKQLLGKAGMPTQENKRIGFDHSTFIPLVPMFPDADIPVLQMSIIYNLDPRTNYMVGAALQPLRDEGVLILGTGSSFHNLRGLGGIYNGRGGSLLSQAKAFDEWLTDACTKHTGPERQALLEAWEQAPGGRQCHPREEHLIPLMVVAGAAADGEGVGRVVNRYHLADVPISSFMFD